MTTFNAYIGCFGLSKNLSATGGITLHILETVESKKPQTGFAVRCWCQWRSAMYVKYIWKVGLAWYMYNLGVVMA